jgi:hypothetical protein
MAGLLVLLCVGHASGLAGDPSGADGTRAARKPYRGVRRADCRAARRSAIAVRLAVRAVAADAVVAVVPAVLIASAAVVLIICIVGTGAITTRAGILAFNVLVAVADEAKRATADTAELIAARREDGGSLGIR